MRIAFMVVFSLVANIAQAQEVDFDKDFPISDEELYAPLIGENGELPSDYADTENANIINAPNTQEHDDAFERFYQQNADAIQEVTEPVYGEPTQGLGYVPQTIQEPEQSSVEIPKNAKSISVNSLPKTSDNETAQQQSQAQSNNANQQLEKLERSVESMELSIESIINRGLSNNKPQEEREAKPLNQVPELTQMSADDVKSVGILSSDNGFRPDVFTASSYKESRELIMSISENDTNNRTFKNILTRLLVTQATPPVLNVPEDEQENWLAIRIKALQSIGEYKQSQTLLAKAGIQAGNVNQFLGLPQAWAENELVTGNTTNVCPFIRNNILNSDASFWRKALLTCQLLTGDEKGLELSLNMVDEKARRSDTLLFNLLDAAQGNAENPILRPDQKISALHASIFMFAPDLLTPNVIDLMPDVALRKIAKNVALDMSLRIQSAESLVQRFNFIDDVALLGLLYDKAQFDEKVVKSPGVERFADAEIDGSIARALLWQASKLSGLPSTRALTLKALWERALKDNLDYLASKLIPELRGIQADSNLAWLAPQVVRQSLRVGDVEHAQKWWSILEKNRSLSRELLLKKDKLGMLMAFTSNKLSKQTLDAWLKHVSLSDETNRKELERYLTLYEASEIQFPDEIWNELESYSQEQFTSNSTEMSALWLRVLGNALESQNVISSLKLLSKPILNHNLQDIGDQTLSNVITGLRFIGLEKDAQRLVFEILTETDTSI